MPSEKYKGLYKQLGLSLTPEEFDNVKKLRSHGYNITQLFKNYLVSLYHDTFGGDNDN